MQDQLSKKTLKAIKQALAILRAENIQLKEDYLEDYMEKCIKKENTSPVLQKKRGQSNEYSKRNTNR